MSKSGKDIKMHDAVIGEYFLRTNKRIKNYSISVSADQVIAKMPLGASTDKMIRFLTDNRQRILSAIEKRKKKTPIRIDFSSKIEGLNFVIHLLSGDKEAFFIQQTDDTNYRIVCPADTDFDDPKQQRRLRHAVALILKHAGSRFLPGRLQELAKATGLSYKRVRIGNTTSRWGSYSSSGTLSLSASLMLLPEHLINFVILHELSHIAHPNHSAAFHALVNELTGGNEKLLEAELKNHSTWKV